LEEVLKFLSGISFDPMISRFSDLKTNVFGRFFICGYGPLYLSDDLK
jgi:hypothetical protein